MVLRKMMKKRIIALFATSMYVLSAHADVQADETNFDYYRTMVLDEDFWF